MKKIVLCICAMVGLLMFTEQSKAQGYNSLTGSYGNTQNPANQYGNAYAGTNQNQPSSTNKGGNKSIVLYYEGLKIEKTATGRISCPVQFKLMNKTDFDINAVSAKLNWSVMKTSVNFKSVKAGETAILKYRLLGNGCLSMSGEPEIVLSRCRIKDMSQDDCAEMIQWRN